MDKKCMVENEKVVNNFIYCGQRKCPHIDCLRHNKNIPFGKLIRRDNFKPDKEWNCKDIIT